MYFLYSLLFGSWVVLLTPYFLYRAWKHQKYLPALRQRLGHLPESLKSDGRPTVWIHSCSVGETYAGRSRAARGDPAAAHLFAVFDNVRDELTLAAPIYPAEGVSETAAWDAALERIAAARAALAGPLPQAAPPVVCRRSQSRARIFRRRIFWGSSGA